MNRFALVLCALVCATACQADSTARPASTQEPPAQESPQAQPPATTAAATTAAATWTAQATPAVTATVRAQTVPLGATPSQTAAVLTRVDPLPELESLRPAVSRQGDLVTAIRDVGRTARPAVVFIAVRGTAPRELLRPEPVQGVGSGAIYDASGLIVTNNHVVENATDITVTLPDGRSFDGRVVGRDPATDLAVVRIDGDNLPVLAFGDSDRLEVGDWVVAIGNALGLEGGPTLTAGVVGALNRSIEEPSGATLQDLIQTDAAINPGNSGGPLVNLAGEIVGINTAGALLEAGVPASGLGFAISINSARPILDQLAASGRVVRAFLGVSAVTITPALAAQNDLPVDEGVILARVGDGTAAARAGLRAEDILVELDGQAIHSLRDLREVLGRHAPGDTIDAVVVRGDRRSTVSITLDEAPAP